VRFCYNLLRARVLFFSFFFFFLFSKSSRRKGLADQLARLHRYCVRCGSLTLLAVRASSLIIDITQHTTTKPNSSHPHANNPPPQPRFLPHHPFFPTHLHHIRSLSLSPCASLDFLARCSLGSIAPLLLTHPHPLRSAARPFHHTHLATLPLITTLRLLEHTHFRLARTAGSMENEAYLENGFDPNSLKVAELRGILLKHDVDYPSSAKKSILVDLFNANIAARAAKLRSARARISASDEGMINAGSTPEKNEIGATPRRVRRTTRGATEDTTEDDEAGARGTRRRVRTPSRRRIEADNLDDVEMPPPSTVRKTRKSLARLPVEDVVTPVRQLDVNDQDTPFSSHNPFQKGSPSPAKSPDPERRRVGVSATHANRSGCADCYLDPWRAA